MNLQVTLNFVNNDLALLLKALLKQVFAEFEHIDDIRS